MVRGHGVTVLFRHFTGRASLTAVSFFLFSLSRRCRMDDIQLCKEITRLKKELHKLVSLPGRRKGLGRFSGEQR